MPSGRVVAAHGRHFLVDDGEGVVECVMRGKKGGVTCGDRVEYQLTHAGSGVIERVEPRANLLYRSDELREKLIAANVDLAVVVTAAVPCFREELLIRCLVACAAADIPALILLNKTDLPQTAALAEHLGAYRALGYELLAVSALGDLRELEARLAGRTSVLVGGSGMGKSSLLNRLVPGADAVTGEISRALDAGRHTTTHARLYRLPAGGEVIDSPGMQEFGLRHLDAAALMAAFPEIHARLGQCRFYNCRHLGEPGCAVRAAVDSGAMMPLRYKVYQSLLGQRASMH
ncbi:MAG: ribosome bioproteinis GTPase [bacterium]|nr:MAG: ribosome bioproteinis GTPase [bacterium]KAF0148066.1 MAG: ribosome bioproteinis GTPase [bacterium]KAF0167582.1 MAG: ribosome bioproteinis GTPase [bacterium]TXT17475.1 MAG: ribosome bioproteinis GTPase [bacterium]